jgi:hypothetical protein
MIDYEKIYSLQEIANNKRLNLVAKLKQSIANCEMQENIEDNEQHHHIFLLDVKETLKDILKIYNVE